MKSLISFVVVVVVTFLSMTDIASAQVRGGWGGGRNAGSIINSRGGGYRGGYGSYYYDPAYLQQMIRLPDGLVACTVDLAATRVMSCHLVIKDVALIEAHAHDHFDRAELLGTIHPEKGKLHFRPFDDTNGRLGTFSGGALGAGAGAMAGYGSTRGMRNRDAANAIGAGATIGGSFLAGWLASRHNHDNCLVIEPTVAQSGGLSGSPAIVESKATTSAVASGLSIRNESGETAYVYDGNEVITTLASGASTSVGKPKTSYRAFVERFNERGMVESYELGRRAEGPTLVFTAEGQVLPPNPSSQ